jgi:poly-gamma-glutamate synthesis protein (capsule biosynthesis protein)
MFSSARLRETHFWRNSLSRFFVRRPITRLFLWMILCFSITGCASRAVGQAVSPAPTHTAAVAVAATAAPTVTTAPSATPENILPHLWVSPSLPQAFVDELPSLQSLNPVSDPKAANLRLEIGKDKAASATTDWIYAVAAPFPTVPDAVSNKDLQAAWKGATNKEFGQHPLMMSAETRSVLEGLWGPAASDGIQVLPAEDLLDAAWKNQPAWAVIPFESIEPRWKVLEIDGQSPLSNTFDAAAYPLAIPIHLTGNAAALQTAAKTISLPTNRDPKKLTVIALTGVTALSRHIGEKMDAKGYTYPAQKIGSWLANADLTHISNEVSFYQDCPKPGPNRADMRFCSNPNYIQLLEAVGTDIVELTGNHNLDWGIQPFMDTLTLYQERGWKTYGGGATLKDALQPLLIDHNGNHFAFIGCSPAGPEPVWATSDKPGSAPCDLDKMEKQIQDLRAQGYLPIVTLQAVETNMYVPTPAQATPNFRRLARAGAVIVSGSQSHVPQTMTFVTPQENQVSFVHYGLGNLFFDEMNPIETRQQFIDLHTFYDGKYLGVNLKTALLEDYSQPRPMTTSERDDFLEKIFSSCNWNEQ